MGLWFIENEEVGDVLKDRPAETLECFIERNSSSGVGQASIGMIDQRRGSHVEAENCCIQSEVDFASIPRRYGCTALTMTHSGPLHPIGLRTEARQARALSDRLISDEPSHLNDEDTNASPVDYHIYLGTWRRHRRTRSTEMRTDRRYNPTTRLSVHNAHATKPCHIRAAMPTCQNTAPGP